MRKAEMKLNFKEDTAQIFVQNINLCVTQSSHYVVLLCKLQYMIDERERNPYISRNKTLSAKKSI